MKSLSTLLAGAFAAACGARATSPTVLDRARAEQDAAHVLDDWHAAAARADETAYFAHFAQGGVFLGTDATERWTVDAFRAYAHPRFARGRAWTMRAVARHVALSPDGRVAWFDEALDAVNLGPARGSGVLVRGADGGWRIAQYNLAITVPNERFAEVRRVLEASAQLPLEAPGAP